MRLGILETGETPPDLMAAHGPYPQMFVRMLSPMAPELSFPVYRVLDQEFPDSVEACEAWLVIGSKWGAYDPEPWIPPLESFLQAAFAADRPIIGVCFGHQILAQALGGRVEKSVKGWGCGVHDYRLPHRLSWTPGAGDSLSLHAMHQDQVVAPPPETTVIATSEFCEIAGLAYGDPERPKALSLQPHPEYDAGFVRDLVLARRGEAVPAAVADAAIDGLGAPVMNQKTADWITRYLRSTRK